VVGDADFAKRKHAFSVDISHALAAFRWHLCSNFDAREADNGVADCGSGVGWYEIARLLFSRRRCRKSRWPSVAIATTRREIAIGVAIATDRAWVYFTCW
jgi:hypothetical protein